MKTTLLTFATLAAAFLLTSCGETQKLTPDQALASSKVLPAPDFGRDDAQPAVQTYQYRESFKASDSEEAQSQEYRVELSQPEGIAPHEFVITGLAEIANLHATASSALFGFVDDLELYADQARGQLQARSVSRSGDSDLGVNGRRLASLNQALDEALNQALAQP